MCRDVMKKHCFALQEGHKNVKNVPVIFPFLQGNHFYISWSPGDLHSIA